MKLNVRFYLQGDGNYLLKGKLKTGGWAPLGICHPLSKREIRAGNFTHLIPLRNELDSF